MRIIIIRKIVGTRVIMVIMAIIRGQMRIIIIIIVVSIKGKIYQYNIWGSYFKL